MTTGGNGSCVLSGKEWQGDNQQSDLKHLITLNLQTARCFTLQTLTECTGAEADKKQHRKSRQPLSTSNLG